MIARLGALLRRFRREERGLAAIEFALIAPVMLISLLGAVELSNAMMADRKATQAASTLADLVSQDTSVTNAEMTSILDAVEAVIFPVTPNNLGLRVTSIVANGAGVTTVAWSSARGMAARTVGQAITVPAGMVAPNGSVIFAEIQFGHDSTFGDIFSGMQGTLGSTIDNEAIKNGWTITDQFYLRPRRTITVARVP